MGRSSDEEEDPCAGCKPTDLERTVSGVGKKVATDASPAAHRQLSFPNRIDEF